MSRSVRTIRGWTSTKHAIHTLHVLGTFTNCHPESVWCFRNVSNWFGCACVDKIAINLTKRYDVYEIPDLWVLVVGKWQQDLTRSSCKTYSPTTLDTLSVPEKDISKLFLSFVKTGSQISLHDCDRLGMLVWSFAFTVRPRSGSSPQPTSREVRGCGQWVWGCWESRNPLDEISVQGWQSPWWDEETACGALHVPPCGTVASSSHYQDS